MKVVSTNFSTQSFNWAIYLGGENFVQYPFNVSCRPCAKEAEADGVIHNLVRALVYIRISTQQWNESLRDLTHK